MPVAAVAIAAWLAWDTLAKEGPTITVSFSGAEGLQAGQSQLKFKDLTLGTVKSIALTPDHARVVATVGTVREATPLLTDQTVFWIVKPRLFAGNLSGLGTLISGSYIGMLPGKTAGHKQRDFVGLEDPPVLETDTPGRTFLVRADRLGSISLGSPVFFRDLPVGQVLGWDLGDMAESATIHVFVREPFDRYVHNTSRFWNASGITVKLSGAGVDVQLESLRALLLGGIAFETPGSAREGEASAADHVFPLFASHDAADSSTFTRRVPLIAYFSGSVAGLAVGSNVTLHGLKVGQVTAVDLIYDKEKDTVLAPVRFEVEPERFVGIGKKAFADVATGIEAAVARGLRASLQSANLLTGQQQVALDFIPDAAPAKVAREGEDFVMPTTESGGFSGLQASAAALLDKINQMPFAQIGKSLDATLEGLAGIANGGELKQSLAALTATLVSAQDTLRKIDSGVTPLLRRLPDIASSAQSAVTDANRLMLSLDEGYGDNTKFHRDLGRLMVELNDAVRSVRAMADLLARHPEALIRGRTNTGIE